MTSVRKIGTNSEQSTHVLSNGSDLYEFIKTTEMYRNTIGKQSTLVLSTDSDLYKFLKSSDPEIKGSDPTQRAAHSPVIPHLVPQSHE